MSNAKQPLYAQVNNIISVKRVHYTGNLITYVSYAEMMEVS